VTFKDGLLQGDVALSRRRLARDGLQGPRA